MKDVGQNNLISNQIWVNKLMYEKWPKISYIWMSNRYEIQNDIWTMESLIHKSKW